MTEPKQTLTSQCYDRLTDSILNGELLPGEKLLSEDLKLRYGVGMSPIREALSKLAATHLVTFEEHKGFAVAKMTPSQVRDDIQTFIAIESLCLKLSIEHGKDLWEEQIVAALHTLKKIEGANKVDYFSWAPVNVRFHNALVSACPLKSLMEIRNRLYERHQWYILLCYKFVDPSIFQANHQEHQDLAEAVIRRKTDLALKILNYHIASGIDELIAKLASKGFLNESS